MVSRQGLIRILGSDGLIKRLIKSGCSLACRSLRYRRANSQGSGPAMHACLLSGLLESVARPQALMSYVQGMNRLLQSQTDLCKLRLLGNLQPLSFPSDAQLMLFQSQTSIQILDCLVQVKLQHKQWAVTTSCSCTPLYR